MRRSFCVSGDSRRLKRDLTGVKNLIAKKVSKQNPIKWVSKKNGFSPFVFYLLSESAVGNGKTLMVQFNFVPYSKLLTGN